MCPAKSDHLNNLESNILGAITKYKKLPQSQQFKVEIWVKGDFATATEIVPQFNEIKEANLFLESINHEYVSKIFYAGPDGITQLIW